MLETAECCLGLRCRIDYAPTTSFLMPVAKCTGTEEATGVEQVRGNATNGRKEVG